MKVSTLRNYLNRLPRDFDNKEITYRDYKTGTVYNSPEYVYVVDESDDEYLDFIFNYDNPITNKQIKAIHAVVNELGFADSRYRQVLDSLFDTTSCKELTESQASILIETLNKIKDNK